MKIDIEDTDDVIVLHIETRMLGQQPSTDIHETIETHLKSGKGNFILDLSAVKLINSVGIGIIMTSWTMVDQNNGQLAVAAPTKKVKEIIELTEIDQVVTVRGSVKAVLKKWNTV